MSNKSYGLSVHEHEQLQYVFANKLDCTAVQQQYAMTRGLPSRHKRMHEDEERAGLGMPANWIASVLWIGEDVLRKLQHNNRAVYVHTGRPDW